MATAGTPDSARPVKPRSAMSVGQSGAKAAASVAAAAAASETVMMVFRPKTSDSAPAPNMATASTPVAADSDKLAEAGEIENARAKVGIIGCTQYRTAKVAMPPR